MTLDLDQKMSFRQTTVRMTIAAAAAIFSMILTTANAQQTKTTARPKPEATAGAPTSQHSADETVDRRLDNGPTPAAQAA
jgi:hypothetical protein